MSLNLSSRAVHACATSLNTKASLSHTVSPALVASDDKANCKKDSKVVYRRYASLFFVCGIGSGDNELVTLEIIHRYVEVLDRYFGNVSSLLYS